MKDITLVKTVERIVGFKLGKCGTGCTDCSGGTGCVSSLSEALDLKFFPELWTIRAFM